MRLLARLRRSAAASLALSVLSCSLAACAAEDAPAAEEASAAASTRGVKALALFAEWQVAWKAYRFFDRVPVPSPLGLRTQERREISIEIAAPVDHVFAVYADVEQHVGRHPFLKEIYTHARRVSDGVVEMDFSAIEDVPLLGVPVRLHTHAQQRTFERELRYEVDSFDAPDVVTHQDIAFADLGDGRTRVTESIVFETNGAAMAFTVKNGMSAHEANQASLKAAFESGEL
ncbi:hypothetical protein EON77_05405 [bacterium]|nr:MAG: hypothetical protein EON77_05405 [bacterium]